WQLVQTRLAPQTSKLQQLNPAYRKVGPTITMKIDEHQQLPTLDKSFLKHHVMSTGDHSKTSSSCFRCQASDVKIPDGHLNQV
ncbi:hypothetical protein OKA04_24465, partial [Luteolibacter flavescens]|nr:hypothetical protein [Luteolibacter flavescens]